MQRPLFSSLLLQIFHRGGRVAAFAVLCASACSDAGLDTGDDSARVTEDKEVGSDGDEPNGSAPAVMPTRVNPAEETPIDVAGSTDGASMAGEGSGESSQPDADVSSKPANLLDPARPQPIAAMPSAVPGGISPQPVPVVMPVPVSSTPTPTQMPAPSVCADGSSVCSGVCVDLTADQFNCGACGVACPVGTLCVAGTCAASCGNGIVENGEGCDDGNTMSGDGCDSTCRVESAFVCPTPDGVPCLVGVCDVDGEVTSGEQCDDGNYESGDGCDKCQVEAGWSCGVATADADGGTSAGSVCTSLCGDGIVAGDEECDLGMSNGVEGCSEECTL